MYFPTPMSLTSQLPLIDPAADVGKYVKAILLHPEKTLSRVYNVGERYYSIAEIIEILQRNGVDVSLKVISQEDFKAGLAAKGAPEFFQEDLVQVISFGVEFGFFEEGVEGGHEVCTSIRVRVGTTILRGLTQWIIAIGRALDDVGGIVQVKSELCCSQKGPSIEFEVMPRWMDGFRQKRGDPCRDALLPSLAASSLDKSNQINRVNLIRIEYVHRFFPDSRP
jgi:hypothetical protein